MKKSGSLPVQLSGCLLLLLLAAASAMSLPFQTIEKSYDSGIDEELIEVYRSREHFDAFWRRNKSNQSKLGKVPDVDFTSQMVVAVYWGTKNSGGYDLEITSINQDEERNVLVVTYLTASPPPGAMLTMALTQPHHIITLDASDKTVVFEGSARPPPPPLFPTFVLTLEEGKDYGSIVASIKALPAIKNVMTFFGGKIVIVDFDCEKISEDEARGHVQGVEGVDSIEEER